MFNGPNLSKSSLTDTIKANLITWLDNGFLSAGGYYNVNIPQSGAYNGFQHKLRPVEDPRYSSGIVWEGFRENWVYESGIGIDISGVFVNNSFLPYSSGYYIDYVGGRVIFDTPRSLSSTVQLEYSYKWVKVEDSCEFPLFKIPQVRSFRSDSSEFSQGSGQLSTLHEQRVQLPVIGVEIVSNNKDPYQIGNGFWNRYRIKCHVLGEDSSSVHSICDLINNQEEETIFAFDLDSLARANKFPLDYRGEVNPSGASYDTMIAYSGVGGYRTDRFNQGKIRLYDFSSKRGQDLKPLYYNVVDFKAEIISLDI